MEGNDKEIDLESLSKILTKVKDLFYKKEEQLEQLENEIAELRDIINSLNSVISNKSFTTADEVYQTTLKSMNKVDVKTMAKQFFEDEIPVENVKDTTIKRKIFSEIDDSLLCVLKFMDFNKVIIKIVNPEKVNLKEASEDFINIFLKGALLKIIENNSAIEKFYYNLKDTDVIEKIEITNLKSLDEYDLITDKITELLNL